MRKLFLKSMLLLCALIVGSGDLWADPVVLFHETFGDNSGSARAWSDSYSVKSGVSAVYSGITGYTISNAKQSKNTMGSTASGLTQTTAGTDAYIIIGPLNVASYSTLSLTYQWNAGSVKKTYSTSLYYASSSGGSYTEVSGTGAGATSFVTRTYSLPAAAQISTLYLKIVWNTSNTSAIIDEVNLTGVAAGGGGGGSSVDAPTFDPGAGAVISGSTVTLTQASADEIRYTTDGTDPTKTTGTVYSTPIVITSATTIKAIAVKDNVESDVVTAAYTVTYAGAVDITPNYTFFGKNAAFSGDSNDEVSGTKAGITVTYTRNTGSCYANSSAMRFYKDNVLTIEAPTDKVITYVSINTVTSDVSTDPEETYNASTGTWIGKATSVSFSRPNDASSYVTISTITVVLAHTITPTPDGYATFFVPSSAYNVQLPTKDDSDNSITVTAYTGTYSAGALTLIPLTGATSVVPKNTPVILKSSNGNAFTLTPTGSAAGTAGSNDLVGADADITGDDLSAINKPYVLGYKNSETSFFQFNGTTIPAEKAYLVISNYPAAAPGIRIIVEENNATDVNNIESTDEIVKFIQNGQLFIKRNGVVYDAMGHVIR